MFWEESIQEIEGSPEEDIMKNLIVAFAICFVTVFGGCRPANAMETCYKVEFQGETFSYVAPETGSYTFKGGNVEHSPNGYLITVNLSAGETWVVPDVNGRPGAAISHVVICPTMDTPDDPDPECIYKDPAIIRYGTVDTFRMHGRIKPLAPLDYTTGLGARLVADGAALAEFDADYVDVAFTTTRAVAKTPSSTFIVKTRPGGLFAVKILHAGDIAQSATDQIVFEFWVGDQWFSVTGSWRERKTGWFLSNRAYLCPVID